MVQAITNMFETEVFKTAHPRVHAALSLGMPGPLFGRWNVHGLLHHKGSVGMPSGASCEDQILPTPESTRRLRGPVGRPYVDDSSRGRVAEELDDRARKGWWEALGMTTSMPPPLMDARRGSDVTGEW